MHVHTTGIRIRMHPTETY